MESSAATAVRFNSEFGQVQTSLDHFEVMNANKNNGEIGIYLIFMLKDKTSIYLVDNINSKIYHQFMAISVVNFPSDGYKIRLILLQKTILIVQNPKSLQKIQSYFTYLFHCCAILLNLIFLCFGSQMKRTNFKMTIFVQFEAKSLTISCFSINPLQSRPSKIGFNVMEKTLTMVPHSLFECKFQNF